MTKEELLNFLADLVANKEREANEVEARGESQGLLSMEREKVTPEFTFWYRKTF